MSRYPANIRCTPIYFSWVILKDIFKTVLCVHHISSASMDDSFRLSCGSRSIEDEEWIFCLHRFSRADWRCSLHRFMPFYISLNIQLIVNIGVFENNHCFDGRTHSHCFINCCLHRDDLSSSKCSIRRNHQFTACILNSIWEGLCRKTTKHNRMNRTHSSTGEHCNDWFQNHRHINTHPIPFFYSILFENIGKFTDLVEKFLIGDFFGGIGRCIWFPIKSDIMCLLREMSVETILCDVQFSSFKPGNICCLKISGKDTIPWFFPDKFLRLFFPK